MRKFSTDEKISTIADSCVNIKVDFLDNDIIVKNPIIKLLRIFPMSLNFFASS